MPKLFIFFVVLSLIQKGFSFGFNYTCSGCLTNCCTYFSLHDVESDPFCQMGVNTCQCSISPNCSSIMRKGFNNCTTSSCPSKCCLFNETIYYKKDESCITSSCECAKSSKDCSFENWDQINVLSNSNMCCKHKNAENDRKGFCFQFANLSIIWGYSSNCSYYLFNEETDKNNSDFDILGFCDSPPCNASDVAKKLTKESGATYVVINYNLFKGIAVVGTLLAVFFFAYVMWIIYHRCPKFYLN